MGPCSAPRRAALLLGVLLAVCGTEFPETAVAQEYPPASSVNACVNAGTEITLNAKLGPVKFSCPGSALKPDKAVTDSVALDGTACSRQVTFPELGFAAQLSAPPKGEIGEGSQATEYTFTVTELPRAEQAVCYLCPIPSQGNAHVPSKANAQGDPSGSASQTDCKVKIRVPANPLSASTPAPSSSTPAPSSSSTSTSSAAAPSSSISTFIGAFSVYLCLVKTYSA